MKNNFSETFLLMEEKLNLYKVQINGFHYWLYYRSTYFDYLNQLYNNVGVGFEKKYSKIELISGLLRSFSPRYNIYRRLHDCDILLICHSRRVLEDCQYKSIYTDYFSDKLDKVISIEYPYQLSHPGLSDRPNSICFDRYFWNERIVKIVKKAFANVDFSDVEDTCEQIVKFTHQYLGIIVNKKKLVSDIVRRYYRYQFFKRKINKIFDKTNPKIVIEVVSYNFENMIFNEIAHERNVKIIEIQHGLIGKDHIAYNYSQKNIITFPDIVFVFGEYWKHRASFPINIDNIIPVGFPYFENKLKQRINKIKEVKYKTILFISQGTVGSILSIVAYNLSKMVDECECRIIYKLHPGEFSIWKERYSILLNSTVHVVTDEQNLYDLFQTATVQIGVASTAIYEGLGFGLKTLIYECSEAKHLMDLCDNKYAVLVRNEKEILQAISCEVPNKNQITEAIWRSNSINNIIKEIKDIEHVQSK